jgi:hypothetical protein
MRIECGLPFVIDSSREAVFVVSPIAVYSSLRDEPTVPDMIGLLLTPIPIRKPSRKPFRASHWLKRGSRSRSISRAAVSARSAWSSASIGAPKTA